MELYTYFNEELIDSVCLDEGRVRQPGYIGQKKRYLLNLQKDHLNQMTEPLFYVYNKDAIAEQWAE